MSSCTMIVLAAGRGTRFAGQLPKQYLPLGHAPLLWHTLNRLHPHPCIDRILPVIAPAGEALWQEIMAPLLPQLPKVSLPVAGGTERQHSVFQALQSMHNHDDHWVAIHDGARPLVDLTLLDRLFAARQQCDAIIPALLAADTVKQIDHQQYITATLNRQHICLVQTPQLFRLGVIRHAHQQAARDGFLGTDDASLVERLHRPVLMVPGSPWNIKITYPQDQHWAAWWLQHEESLTWK
ncbi:2-C-methyl-D-erythritol 4-phosphate cytidylyltransferase [Candidatus Magnetaquicoccus inordinatus]|uniref:2-C-methyl-D-erythritol 4-phosphate cytidylyltransferase n=1 Tax=Candidatus Magnetaquicoccus inordinatus TaxID=2496818 RepID=UPI00102D223F|nr:2-C-methyl-D-erythritol 4-phosphate cytidylyltransferase [Candidatus Magnetaquicoccus inordinatus]